MIESIVAGFFTALSFNVICFMLVGILLGLLFGLMPGISFLTIMAIVLPLTFGMKPEEGLTLLLAIYAVGCTGGSITAILLNIPGSANNAATMMDGYPMTQRGEGGRAIGAALCASGLGGVFGALILALLIPVAHTIVIAFGAPETFLIALLGLTFIAVVSQDSFLKGIISGLLGLLIGFVGVQSVSGIPRFTLGSVYLYDGFPLIPFILGMFALPEVFELILNKGQKIASAADELNLRSRQGEQVWQGFLDVFRHWSLFIRCSLIGSVIGLIPGVGGEVAIFVSYAHARQTSKNPEAFGKGTVEGVIAPESANNSKEGGSMLPTFAFGIPGSVGMAVLLGALTVHGVTPGPTFLTDHLDLTWSLLFVLIFSNVLGVLFLLPFLRILTKIAFVRGRLMIPLILVIAAFGAYASEVEFWGIVLTFGFGIVSYIMKKFNYNRVAILLGFILGKTVETYAYISFKSTGLQMFSKPGAIIISLIILSLFIYEVVKAFYKKEVAEV